VAGVGRLRPPPAATELARWWGLEDSTPAAISWFVNYLVPDTFSYSPFLICKTHPIRNQIMTQDSLSALVDVYRREHKHRIADYLGHFQKLKKEHKPLDDALSDACHGKDGQIHDHQHRVGKKKLEQARKQLQKHADEIEACGSFDALHKLVDDCTSSIKRFGVLAVYDTSLRLGAYLDKWPEVVYLHAGTKKGCKALGMPTKGGKVEMEKLLKPIQMLKPYEAEDFLCHFIKDNVAEGSGKLKGC
jgi:hypothetical protein